MWRNRDRPTSKEGPDNQSAIAELHAITEEYRNPPQNREEDRLHHEATLQFHASLARHSKNQLLSFIIGFMAEVLSEVTTNRQLFEPRNTELWAKGQEFQFSLLTALEQGDPIATRQIMSDHMGFAETLMLQQEVRVKRKFGDL